MVSSATLASFRRSRALPLKIDSTPRTRRLRELTRALLPAMHKHRLLPAQLEVDAELLQWIACEVYSWVQQPPHQLAEAVPVGDDVDGAPVEGRVRVVFGYDVDCAEEREQAGCAGHAEVVLVDEPDTCIIAYAVGEFPATPFGRGSCAQCNHQVFHRRRMACRCTMNVPGTMMVGLIEFVQL